jgi:acyl-homoserine-lactone acylase
VELQYWCQSLRSALSAWRAAIVRACLRAAEPPGDAVPVSGKEQIDTVGHRSHQWPAQERYPLPASGEFPCQHRDIQTIDQRAVSKFSVQDAVGLHRVNVREALGEIGRIDVLQVKCAGAIESLQMPHLVHAKGAESVVVDAQCAGLWCIHVCMLPLLVQGVRVSTLPETRQIFVCAATLPFPVPMGFTRHNLIVPEPSFMQPRPCGKTLLAILLLCSLLACSPSAPAPSSEPGPAPASAVDTAAAESARLQAIAERITIIRDDYGVPHIYAPTDAEAVFGLLYAQAEDDFARVERNYIWAIGRLAEVEGESALYSDLRARLYMSEDEARAAYAAAPAWLQSLCDAFADGLNYYLASNPQVQPRLLTRFEPWMPFFFFEGSIGGDIEQIPLRGIEAFYSDAEAIETRVPDATQSAAALNAGTLEALQAERNDLASTIFEEPAGSNGFAISGERTASGDAMLLINPHTSFFFRGEAHVVSEEGLNAYGAVTWGQFFIYQGFNETTGWMHTTTAADFIDEFVEDVVRDNGELKYRYGEELRALDVAQVTLKVREGDALVERSFPVYRTHHGPVTHLLEEQWVVTRINWNTVDALRQSYLRMKTANYTAFLEMMDIRTNSSNNTVFADAEGNIAYFHGNFMPRRDPQFDYSQPVDGSNPATDWQDVHPVDETITLLNPPNGWIQNTNSTPFTAAGEFSPRAEDYPAYMAPDAQNFRALHAMPLLDEASQLTLDSLIELAYDPYLPGFEQLIPGLVSAWDAAAADWPALAAPIEVLRQWDRRVSAESVGMTLAHFYGMDTAQKIPTPAGLVQMDQINWLGTDSDPGERLRVFSETIAQLDSAFGSWNTPWGEINRYQRLTGDIDHVYDDAAPSLPVGMASSRWGALASFGARAFPGTNRIYGNSGNSFVAVVEFGERVRAKSMLAGGQNANPDSPHFDDQAQRYIDREFKDVAFYREDVEARAVRSYSPGERQ